MVNRGLVGTIAIVSGAFHVCPGDLMVVIGDLSVSLSRPVALASLSHTLTNAPR